MVSLSYLFQCWDQFKRGKRKKKEIQHFERYLEDHIFQLQHDLITLQYQHGPYHHFYVFDPKERSIGKSSVRDRLVHQVVYSLLSDIFDPTFIFHSLSSRRGKGIHLGLNHLQRMIRKVSRNGKKPCYALKMDIRRFFDTVDHQILKILIRKKVHDEKLLQMIDIIIDSFKIRKGAAEEVGIPLGNVTSQLFANIYLHELDVFVKQKLHERYYLRYCDDFIVLSTDEAHLKQVIVFIREFLSKHLRLELHPKKVVIRKLGQGIDFIGYVFFSKYRIIRAKTRKRMQKRLKEAYITYLKGTIEAQSMDQRLQSYLGMLSHATHTRLSQALINAYWVRPLPE